MKKSLLIIALSTCYLVACDSTPSHHDHDEHTHESGDHDHDEAHSHEGDDHAHGDHDHGTDHTQEEFTVEADTVTEVQ